MDEAEKKRAKPAHDPFAPPPEDMPEIPLATDHAQSPSNARMDARGDMFELPADDGELTLEDEKPRTQLGPDAFAPPLDAFSPRPERGGELKLEEYEKKARPRNALVERMEQEKAPRAGCRCKKHYDLYLDNDFGGMAAWIGGGFGLLLLTLAYWMGPFGALSIALFGATCGGLATVISISLRCEGCRRTVTGLNEEELDWLKRGRQQVIKYTAMLGVFTAFSIAMWFWIL